MFLRGAPRNAWGICWKCSTSCYMYMLYVYIYIICYRHKGKQVDRRNFNVLKDQGSEGSTDLFRPSYWAIDAEMLPTSRQPINMSTRIDDHPCSGKNKRQ